MLQDNLFTGTFSPEIEENLNLKELCLGNNGYKGTPPADIETDETCVWKIKEYKVLIVADSST